MSDMSELFHAPAMLRVPPSAVESECTVLGALLLENQSFDRVSDRLKPEHFYRLDNQLVFTEISRQLSAGKHCDVFTVYAALKDQDITLECLNELAQYVPSSANLVRHAEIVIERAKSRSLVQVAVEIDGLAFDSNRGIEERVEAAQAQLSKLISDAPRDEWVGAYEGMVAHTQVMEDRAEGRIRSWATGFVDLDDYLEGGMQPGSLYIIGARPSMGKAQPLGAKVLLQSGDWAAMGSLKAGDRLASVDGMESVVTGVYPQGVKQVNVVTFSDGRKTRCCDEHLWRVHHRKWAHPRVLSTAEIATLLRAPSMRKRMWIERASGDFGDKSALPLDPWVMGALLGDGSFSGNSTVRFTKPHKEIVETMRSRVPAGVVLSGADGEWRLRSESYRRGQPTSNLVTLAVRHCGLSGTRSEEKFIPEMYMRASRPQRLDLLRGLMDTDGWVEKHNSVLFSTASHRLAVDVQALARSLGYWCSIHSRVPKYTYKGEKKVGKTAFCLNLSGPGIDEVFLFSGKRDRCAMDRSREARLSFDRIEPAGMEDCQCISVSHPSRLYVTDDYIVTHNTALAMSIGLHMARDYSVGMLSMEMPHKELRDRMTSMLGRVSLSSVIRPNKGEGLAWDRVLDGAAVAKTLNFRVSDQGGLNINQVRSKARNLKRMHGLDVLIVDYIGLMAGLDAKQPRVYQMEEISRGLKTLGKELNAAIVCLAQLNRKVEERVDAMPMLSDLRDSGAIEQDADVVMFVHRPIHAKPDLGEEFKHYAKLSIAKNRQGRCGVISLFYQGDQTRFDSWSGDAPAAVGRTAPKPRGFHGEAY